MHGNSRQMGPAFSSISAIPTRAHQAPHMRAFKGHATWLTRTLPHPTPSARASLLLALHSLQHCLLPFLAENEHSWHFLPPALISVALFQGVLPQHGVCAISVACRAPHGDVGARALKSWWIQGFDPGAE
jgi:hypothetical protein